MVSFEVKKLKKDNYCCHGNKFFRECWAKNHDLKEEKWHIS